MKCLCFPRAGREAEDSLCRGGAVPRGGVCKTGEAPARGAARSAAGGRRRRPKAGDAFRSGGTRPAPLTQNLRGEYGISPERPPAERVLPAPRAGEQTLSAFLHWLRPLRPAPGTVRNPAPRGGDSLRYHVTIIARHTCGNFRSPTRARDTRKISSVHSPRAGHNDSSASRFQMVPRSPAPASAKTIKFREVPHALPTVKLLAYRPARAPRNHFPRCNPRAVLEIKNNRFPLHKHSVSTYPFPLTPAFLQPSASGERSDIPRPCLKKQGRRGRAFPWGGSPLPEGRTFSGYFSFRYEK